ncbi:MAG: tRNA (adenosine(37)-N6)-dimethylallyltransferase MiaA [Bacteroidia bacterium]|nr:tRNA (adenosine(37)-N6)-dimethylallyltransferase MiaA [Bacteroidia bacterium]
MKYLISIIGPTAVGKTSFSLHLAHRFQAPILSADSRQVYHGMDIGTAKPTSAEMEGIPHYFVDDRDPTQPYNAGIFRSEAEKVLEEIYREKFIAIVAGGSGLYFKALWEGFDEMPTVPPEIRAKTEQDFEAKGLAFLVNELQKVDPESYGRIELANPKRVMRALEVFRATGQPISTFRKGEGKGIAARHIKVGLTMDRPELYARIEERVDAMLAEGLEAEARRLFEQYGSETDSMQTVGYQEFIPYFQGEYDLEEAIRLVKRNTRRLAKRQYTWFRRYEDIAWFERDEYRDMENHILSQIGVD